MTLAYSASAWTEIIVAFSIFGPVAIALALTITVLRRTKNDPDEQRMRQAQRDYEASRRD